MLSTFHNSTDRQITVGATTAMNGLVASQLQHVFPSTGILSAMTVGALQSLFTIGRLRSRTVLPIALLEGTALSVLLGFMFGALGAKGAARTAFTFSLLTNGTFVGGTRVTSLFNRYIKPHIG